MKKYAILVFVLCILIGGGIILFPKSTDQGKEIHPDLLRIYQEIEKGTELMFLKEGTKNFSGCAESMYRFTGENISYILGISRSGCFNAGEGELLFAGENDLFWSQRISIFDKNKEEKTLSNQNSFGNKPLALTTQDGKLLLTVVDTNGGGSMEGIESVLQLQEDGSWETVKCYNYNNWGNFENKEEDEVHWYARGTIQFKKLTQLPLEECKDNVKVMYHI